MVNNTMYVITPFPITYRARSERNGPAGEVEMIPIPTRGARQSLLRYRESGGSYADGKIVYATLDGQVVQSMQTAERSGAPNSAIDVGETVTMAPLIVKDLSLSATQRRNSAVRGWMRLDSALELVLEAYHTGPDKDVLIGSDFKAFYSKDWGADLGVRPGAATSRQRGGSTQWGWVSYDPGTRTRFFTAPAIRGSGMPTSAPAITSGASPYSLEIRKRDRPNGLTRSRPTIPGITTRLWKTSCST